MQQAQVIVEVNRILVEDLGVPIDDTQLITTSFLEGDTTLKLELDSSINEKLKTWGPAELTLVQTVPMETANRNIAAANLEKEEFQLLLKQIEQLRSIE